MINDNTKQQIRDMITFPIMIMSCGLLLRSLFQFEQTWLHVSLIFVLAYASYISVVDWLRIMKEADEREAKLRRGDIT